MATCRAKQMINIRVTQASRFQSLCLTAVVAGLTACGGGVSDSEQATSATGPVASSAPAPTAGSYAHYPALNLNDIPWHTAAGGWGPQVRLEAPALPVTTRSVTVNNRAEFNAAASIAGTRITIATGWPGNTLATINANDIDVIIPPGVSIGAIEFGVWPRDYAISRVRIRGTTPGTHSGGRMGQYRDYARVSDIIIDGIDLNGDSPYTVQGNNEGWIPFRIHSNRVAVLNSRIISSDSTWLGSARHVVIANSNFYHAASTRAQVGYPGGYGIRNSAGPVTIIDSRVQGTRYHNIRVSSEGNSGELLYVGRSTIVAMAEGRTSWMWNHINVNVGRGQGAIMAGNSIYTYSAPGCPFGPEISSVNVDWSRVANNRFFGGGNAVFNSVTANGGGTEGNTFAALGSFPAWGGPGDPRQVPQPNGLPVITGEGQCPGP